MYAHLKASFYWLSENWFIARGLTHRYLLTLKVVSLSPLRWQGGDGDGEVARGDGVPDLDCMLASVLSSVVSLLSSPLCPIPHVR